MVSLWVGHDTWHLGKRWKKERKFFIDNLLVRSNFIIVIIRWIGLAPRVFEFPFQIA